MKFVERGLAVEKYASGLAKRIIGIEAAERVAGESAIEFEKANEAGGAAIFQLLFPSTERSGMPKEGELILEQIMKKDPFAFAGDIAILAGTMYLMMRGFGWQASAAKIGYNTLVQIVPDVASFVKRK